MGKRLRPIVVAGALLALALWSVPAMAADTPTPTPTTTGTVAGAGTITGTVVNKTPGGTAIGTQEVSLTPYVNGTAGTPKKVTSDSAGKFQFAGLTLDATTSYVASTHFLNTDYYSTDVNVTTTAATQNVEIDVYDETAVDPGLKISAGHFILKDSSGSLQVMEVWQLTNGGNKTYIGGSDHTTATLSLPSGASSVSLGDGMTQSPTGGVLYTLPLPPGDTSLLLAYNIPYQGNSLTLTRKADYDIASFSLLIPDNGEKVTSVSLTDGGKVNPGTGSTAYLSFTATNIKKGADIDASFSGLGSTGGSGGTKSDIGKFLPWIIVAVLAIGLALVLLLPRLRKRQPVAVGAGDGGAVPAEAQPDDEKALLQEMARLDDQFEAGKIKDQEYRTLRAQAKSRLMEIYARKKGAGK